MDCVCSDKKFCKKCYSIYYYRINRNEILQQQKQKYQEKKAEKKKRKKKKGPGIFQWDS